MFGCYKCFQVRIIEVNPLTAYIGKERTWVIALLLLETVRLNEPVQCRISVGLFGGWGGVFACGFELWIHGHLEDGIRPVYVRQQRPRSSLRYQRSLCLSFMPSMLVIALTAWTPRRYVSGEDTFLNFARRFQNHYSIRREHVRP